MAVFDIFDGFIGGVLEIFDWSPRDISFVSWKYLLGGLEIFDWCPGDI